MKTLKQFLNITGWTALLGTWLWYFITQIPVMLSAGMPDTGFALAFIALSAICLIFVVRHFFQGIFSTTNKETP